MKATVITEGAHLREGPSSRSAIKDALVRGDVVQLLDGVETIGPQWLRVRVIKAFPSQVGEVWHIWGPELAIVPATMPSPPPLPDVEPLPAPRPVNDGSTLGWFIGVIGAIVAAVISAVYYFTS